MPEEPDPDHQTTRVRCQAVLDSLDIPDPFDLHAFAARVAAIRGRPIVLAPFRAEDGMSGAFVGARCADYIYYDGQATPLYQAHIVLHELAHMLLGHDSGLVLAALLRMPVPGPDPAGDSPSGHGSYTTAEERDAETLASMILERASRRRRRSWPRARRPAVTPGNVTITGPLRRVIGTGPEARR
jgi:hypothetical protein